MAVDRLVLVKIIVTHKDTADTPPLTSSGDALPLKRQVRPLCGLICKQPSPIPAAHVLACEVSEPGRCRLVGGERPGGADGIRTTLAQVLSHVYT